MPDDPFDIAGALEINARLAAEAAPDLSALSDDELISRAATESRAYRNLDVLGFEVGESGARKKDSPHNVRRGLELLGTDLRYNEFARVVEVGGVRASDKLIDGMRFKLEELFRFLPPKGDMYDLTTNVLAHERTYHPVRDYLAARQAEWDGVERLGRPGGAPSWLTTYAGAADSAYARAVARIVLVAACRRVRDPGCKFDEMLVIEGAQGTGKSTALRVLAVKRGWFVDDMPLGEDAKVVIEQTRGKWIVEVPELVGMSKHDRNLLKSCLSRDCDVARAAYAREVEEHPRQFVMIATTNDREYLGDQTGERRWWPVWTVKFDLAALERDRDQLWAEAAVAEAAGESIRLDASLWAAAAAEQDARRSVDPYEITMANLGDPRVEGRILIADVWGLAGCGEDPSPVQQRRVAAVLQSLGWEKARARLAGRRVQCYQRGTEDRWWSAAEVRGVGNTSPDLRVVTS